MTTIHKTVDGKTIPLNELARGCWINPVSSSEDGCTLIIVDNLAMEQDEIVAVYFTLPIRIIATDHHIITMCLKEMSVVRNMRTEQRTRFILSILLLGSKRYLSDLIGAFYDSDDQSKTTPNKGGFCFDCQSPPCRRFCA